MSMQLLQVEKREGREDREGFIPGVVYGKKQESIPLSFSLRNFEKIFREAGESSVIELQGLHAPLQVLIHEVDRDPVTHAPRHIDFYAIEKGAKVEVEIPLEFVGESPAVKAGANLVKVLHELSVEADATMLPQEIVVNISTLTEIGSKILVEDIALPPGVVATLDPEEVVAVVQEVKEEEEASVGAPDMASIEVEKKGKEEKEEG